jgi:hypothetical protein
MSYLKIPLSINRIPFPFLQGNKAPNPDSTIMMIILCITCIEKSARISSILCIFAKISEMLSGDQ